MRVIVFFFALLLCACKIETKSSAKIQTIDSSYTIIQYIFDLRTNDIKTSKAHRYIFTALRPTKEDSTINSWQTDTFYRVPLYYPMYDSLKKKPLLDSLGKPLYIEKWEVLNPKELLIEDKNKDVSKFFVKKPNASP